MDSCAALAAALVALLLPCLARGFFPNGLDRCDSDDASHESMTAAALGRVAAALGFADESELRGMASYRDALKTIVVANEAVGGAEWRQSVMHFNAEQLTEANEYLADTRDLAILLVKNSSMPDYVLVRRLVGRCLHLIQDFYSNTNWFEQYGFKKRELYQFLGDRGTVIPVDESPCLNAASSEENANNILYSETPFRLTSGFRDGQDKAKPKPNGTGPKGEPKGKCSHGGAYDSSAKLEPKGGINKESSNDSLSPHNIDHADASEMARLATVDFFVHPERGLLRQIGKDKLAMVLGLKPSASITLLVNSRSDWLGSGSTSTDARRVALQGLAEAFFHITLGVRLQGVRLSCDSSQPLFDSASLLHTALLSRELSHLSSDQTIVDQCLIALPEKSAIAAIIDTEAWPMQQKEIDWWRLLALRRSVKLLVFVKQGITITNPGAMRQFKDMCFNTGGGFYHFTDIEDLMQQLPLLPYRVSATVRELHSLPLVATVLPNHTVIAEADCTSRPYANVRATDWSSAAVTTKELWSPSAMRLEEVRFSDNLAAKLYLQDSKCSARLLQTIPFITLELYERGPYNQLFSSPLTGRGKGIRAAIRIASGASTTPAAYSIRVSRSENNSVGTNRSVREYKTTRCFRANSYREPTYVADISLEDTVSMVSVADDSGLEVLSVPYEIPRVRLVGPAYVTDTCQLTVMNLGQAATTAVLRMITDSRHSETLLLSDNQLYLEPNASSYVNLSVKADRLADCAHWWLHGSHDNCTCSIVTRAIIIHVSVSDDAGNIATDMLPVTVIQCTVAAVVVSSPMPVPTTELRHTTTARAITGLHSASVTTRLTSPSDSPQSPPSSSTHSPLPTVDLHREGSPSAVYTAETAGSLPPTTSTSPALSPTAVGTTSATGDSWSTAWPPFTHTVLPTAVATSSATSLPLLAITLACTIGILLLFVLSLGGILYMRKLIGTYRFEQPKRTKALYKDEGVWLREEEP